MRSITIDIDAPATLPVELELLKQDLRILDDDLDEVIQCQYIPAALELCEGFCKRSIVGRTHRWIIDDFPHGRDQTIYLPRGNVNTVESIKYSSGNVITSLTGADASPAGSDFQQHLSGHIARLMPPYGGDWPGDVDDDVVKPVEITYSAGYLTIEDTPSDLKRAITAQVVVDLEKKGLIDHRPGWDQELVYKILSPWVT